MPSPSPRVALVTGGSRGIGRGIAMALAREGIRVAVNYHRHSEEAFSVVAAIRDAGGEAIAVSGDVSVTADVAAMVERTIDDLGRVTILVNNAGMTDTHKPWQEITEEEWDRVLAVNLKSCFLLFRAVYPSMKEASWGRVINISSVTFWLGRPNLLHYVSSKGGMIGFTRTLAREVGSEGITVNAITPGAIQTESELDLFPDQAGIATFLNDVQAVKRRGLPDDIAAAVVYLASEGSSFVTGQTINVDGGWAMH
jgi:3-oxoacyl-[acyl-carrier protein] reductase